MQVAVDRNEICILSIGRGNRRGIAGVHGDDELWFAFSIARSSFGSPE
jgi:hypothetical protein